MITEEERKKFLKGLEKRKKKALENKDSALDFLKECGIITKKGNLKAPYKIIR